MIRALILALGLPAAVQAQCADPDGLTGTMLTGTFTAIGSGQVMGAPMQGGVNEVGVQSTGGGITLVIDGRRMALTRLPPDAPRWDWAVSEGVALTASESGVVLGCDINAMARFEGMTAGVTWRAMAANADSLLLMWSMANPPASGLFLVTRR